MNGRQLATEVEIGQAFVDKLAEKAAVGAAVRAGVKEADRLLETTKESAHQHVYDAAAALVACHRWKFSKLHAEVAKREENACAA